MARDRPEVRSSVPNDLNNIHDRSVTTVSDKVARPAMTLSESALRSCDNE
jgi:hypothetical protein